MKRIDLLIIEDEISVCELYQQCAFDFFINIELSHSCDGAANILRGNRVDCVLLDNYLPDGQGIELLREYGTEEKVIILSSGSADKQLAIDAVNAGVSYFIEKPFTVQELTAILKNARQKVMYRHQINNLVKGIKVGDAARDFLASHYRISLRELEVINCALNINKNDGIAKQLFISTGTVKRHLHNIFDKMDISSKQELKALVYQLNDNFS